MTDTIPAWKIPWNAREFERAYPFTETYPTYTKPESYCSACGKSSFFPVEQLVQIKHRWSKDFTVRSYCPAHANGKDWQKQDPTRIGRNEAECPNCGMLIPAGTECAYC